MVFYEGQFDDIFVVIDGRVLHALQWNPMGKNSIVLLHGLHVQAHVWDPIAAQLSREGYRVICPDFRGHGASAWAQEGGYGVTQFASDIVEMSYLLGLRNCSFVGHSMGARVGIAVAADDPDLVERLMLIDMGPELPRGAAQEASRVVGDAISAQGFESRRDAVAFYKKLFPEWHAHLYAQHAEYQLRQNWAGVFVEKFDPDVYWITGAAGKMEVSYLWSSLSRIEAPTTVVRCQRSPFISDEIERRICNSIGSGRVLSIDGGHFVIRERPRAIADLVAEWMTS